MPALLCTLYALIDARNLETALITFIFTTFASYLTYFVLALPIYKLSARRGVLTLWKSILIGVFSGGIPAAFLTLVVAGRIEWYLGLLTYGTVTSAFGFIAGSAYWYLSKNESKP